MKRLYASSILIIVAYILSALVRTFIIQVYFIPTISMEPTLSVNDRVLVVKKTIFNQDIETGDIVVFFPEDNDSRNNIGLLIDSLNIVKLVNPKLSDAVYIKRIVAKGGDRITISERGKVYINEIQDERYSINNISSSELLDLTVPKNQFFLLGDNIENSIDSRSYGLISEANIVGKAVIKLYPLNQISILDD
ncbi:MAG: signal peptidase I [Actinobacteria bacterium]|nr:signal peptidase I [Actinomycetota bacterium]